MRLDNVLNNEPKSEIYGLKFFSAIDYRTYIVSENADGSIVSCLACARSWDFMKTGLAVFQGLKTGLSTVPRS